MRHNRRSRRSKDIVSVHVVQMIMRVHHKTNRQLRQLANLGEHRLRRLRVLERIDHQDPIVTDHESGIASRQSRVIHNRGPDAIADLLQLKIGNRAIQSNQDQTARRLASIAS